jgi:hypothetical protein
MYVKVNYRDGIDFYYGTFYFGLYVLSSIRQNHCRGQISSWLPCEIGFVNSREAFDSFIKLLDILYRRS